ncbi:MAG: insulinase family protein [Elusimicrobia bacterium]|nr:insulinase family protein [Elusimicrobiota bacterium]
MRGGPAALFLLAALWSPARAEIPFERFELPNGLRVILSPDKAVPVATFAMAFDVGGRQEVKGRSGFAHLFEHLMFEGSAHLSKGRFDKLLEGYGADNNASTHVDFTLYYEVMPSNVLPLAAWLDSDRMSALEVGEKSMRNQISVVKEEKRMRVDNEAYAPLLLVEVASRTFSNFANSHPTIGTFEDLDAATLQDVKGFFDAYYAPKNAWLCVVGDFDPVEERKVIERYFSWIPNRGVPVFPDIAEPRQAGERVFALTDAHAKVPGAAILYNNMPERRSVPDFYALALLGRTLFYGKSSRLYQLLVKEKQAAVAIDEPYAGGLGFPLSDPAEFKAPGLFGAFILHKPETSPAQIRELVYEEVKKIAAGAMGASEIERVKTKFRSDWVVEQQTTLGRAGALLRAAVLDGDPAAANGELERYMAVTPADIQAAAAKYLVPESANVFELKTAPAAEGKE